MGGTQPCLGVPSKAFYPGSLRFLNESAWKRGRAAVQRTSGQSQHSRCHVFYTGLRLVLHIPAVASGWR